MNERRVSSRVSRCVGKVCRTPPVKAIRLPTTWKCRRDMGPVHRRIDLACGEYLLKPKSPKKHSRRHSVSNSHLPAHRPFGLTTEPSGGQYAGYIRCAILITCPFWGSRQMIRHMGHRWHGPDAGCAHPRGRFQCCCPGTWWRARTRCHTPTCHSLHAPH